MTKTAIHVDHIARVEGHGNVHVVIEDGAVKTVEMNVVEPARLFESMVRGRSWREVSYISSRICGICSASHVVTDLKAIERIFGVQVTPRTRALRELLVYGSYLQNHATHLFVLAAPDFVGQKSVFPLAESDPALFEGALGLKALGNELCTAVGGRSIHPITAVVGGFTHEIGAGEYRALADKMDSFAAFAAAAVDLFAGFPVPRIATAGDMLAMVEPDYYPVECSDTARFLDAGIEFDANDVGAHLEEYAVPHSAALLARVRETGSPFFTGALARINASWQHLGQNAKVAAAKAGLRPPERNPFMNNVAQAVELVDALDRCAGICRALAEPGAVEGSSEPVGFEVRAGRGVGFTEAPRGALFHDLELDGEGRVVHASIMTPTAQNVANLEADMRVLAEQLVAEGAEEDIVRLEIEKLVRAYDPCLSCSVH
ncbi:Ni/Fe hydrogenase subunit alpha [Gordonibacter pamelaeae]|uniref:Ni/Fe hydrogenase subunit alpha n=1 Tax=Gordonibacter pamelaeae TaxID=471189 RepID=UPI0012B14B41|nr:Ni/Fe hydrogenase subunit alpha [Gordonibacter pamelaeae]MCB6313488.1 Ni/Fe hydrogenase subunit alpha [Gordonibacter pamelaeae]MCQ4848525.1 Ni/Fe hydrogenase subunit alpha [Gordonibacter pamelaeae]MCQ4849466.1 Ni/Fe hydrogenase subunit alpha [Gordonibacter pamelaeae]MSA61920.1 Ni/Fe hydrogenase subunit alpha [Gordonibacter pamelaeae]